MNEQETTGGVDLRDALWESTNALYAAYDALLRWGVHASGCQRYRDADDPCDCGLDMYQTGTLAAYTGGLTALRASRPSPTHHRRARPGPGGLSR